LSTGNDGWHSEFNAHSGNLTIAPQAMRNNSGKEITFGVLKNEKEEELCKF